MKVRLLFILDDKLSCDYSEKGFTKMAFPSESLEEDSLLNIEVDISPLKKIKKFSEADSINSIREESHMSSIHIKSMNNEAEE